MIICYMKVMGTMKYDYIVTLKLLRLKILRSKGVGGARFAMMCYKVWVGG